jgi:hypothetical protein
MKKFTVFVLICCMAVTMVLVFHEPIRCSDSDPTLVGPDPTVVGVVVVSVLLLAGLIATLVSIQNDDAAKEKDDAYTATLQETWNARTGNWTFDDALALWGTPTSATQGDNISVVIYNKTSTPNLGTHTTYYQGTWLNPATSESNAVYGSTTGDYYTFIFDKNTKMLKKWNIAHYGAAGHKELTDNQAALKQSDEKKSDVSADPASLLKQKLGELKKLLDSGDITKEEYGKARAKLIASFQ